MLERTDIVDTIIESRKKRHDTDLINRGCGYWSVCDEAGFACPCSSDAKVKQGFDNAVWDNMKFHLDKLIAEMENEPIDLGFDDLDDNPYEDFDWDYD